MSNQDEFMQTLENYRYGVSQVLPGYISGRFTDLEALPDELGLVLYSRDVLARILAAGDPFAQARLSEIDTLDRQLLEIKDDLLPLIPAYSHLRQRLPRPRSQWWYYLDEIVSTPLAPTLKVSRYWLPLTPQPVPPVPA